MTYLSEPKDILKKEIKVSPKSRACKAIEFYIEKCLNYLNGRINPQFPCLYHFFYYGNVEEISLGRDCLAYAMRGLIVFNMRHIMDEIILSPVFNTAMTTQRGLTTAWDLSFSHVRPQLLELVAHELAHLSQAPCRDYNINEESRLQHEQETNAYSLYWLYEHREELRQNLGFFYEHSFLDRLYYNYTLEERHQGEDRAFVRDNYRATYKTITRREMLNDFLEDCLLPHDSTPLENLTAEFHYAGTVKAFDLIQNGQLTNWDKFYTLRCLFYFLRLIDETDYFYVGNSMVAQFKLNTRNTQKKVLKAFPEMLERVNDFFCLKSKQAA